MTAIRGLGEIAFRTERLDEMVAFYGDTLGLERIDDPPFDDAAFFRAGEGVSGHTQVLVLFDRSGSEGYTPPDPDRTTADHVAFGVEAADFDAEAERLESLGYELDYAYHEVGPVALAVPRRPGREPRRTGLSRPRERTVEGRRRAYR